MQWSSSIEAGWMKGKKEIDSAFPQSLKTLISGRINQSEMRSIIALTILLALAVPSMALSPIEQAYINGVKDGLRIGQLANDIDQYNIAIQQFNDRLNKTAGGNASEMWLPKIAALSNNSGTDLLKPVHKMDGNPAETTLIQY